jgi:hypothetical protein
MLIVTSATEAMQRQRQVRVNGKDYTLSEFVGAMPVRGHYEEGNELNDDGRPQGFLVTQPPGSVTPAHFHEPNQFQVFVAGSGRLGARPAPPLTVQYANGHTPYGPIVAGPEGLSYFTLRQHWDPGAKYVPGAMDKLKPGNQRTRMASGLELGDDGMRQARGAPQVETIFEPEADGLAACLCRLGPHHTLPAVPQLTDKGGRYLVVAAGTIIHADRDLPKWSTIFVSQSDAIPELASGPGGADLLMLQFPAAAAASRGEAATR